MLKPHICVRQHDLTDCGAACIATVARTHGLRVSIEAIRRLAGTDRQGTNVLGLVEAAQKLGFEAKGVRGDTDALSRIPLPCIAHVSTGGVLHFVVIHEVKSKHLILADPARGVVKAARNEFLAIWSGILILLLPGTGFREGNRSTTPWVRLARLVEPHRLLLAETFLAMVFLVLLGLGPSIYLQLLIDKVLIARDWERLRWLSLGLLTVMGCRAAFGTAKGILSAYIARRIDLSLLYEYYHHVLCLPMQFFDTRHTGEILSRLNDAIKIREAVISATLTLLVDSALIVGSLGLLGLYSLKLALQGSAMLVLLAIIVIAVNAPLKRAQRATMEHAAALQSGLVESLAGITTIKAFGSEEAAGYKAEAGMVRLLRSSFRVNVWGVSSCTAGELVMAVGMVAILWSAGTMVIRGELTVGQMVASYSILVYLLQPMLRLASTDQTIQDALVAVDRLGDVLDLDPESAGESHKVALPADTQGRVDFRHVTFRYGTREFVLEDLSLHIEPRSVVALLGRSGSGKTTLARLLLGFYEPSGGQIEIDGYDIRDLSLLTLRDCIGYVDQDSSLFSGTIEENLTLGDARVTLDAVICAVRAAGLEPFIAGLPNRYRTVIGERGLTLSGGQRQRLAIARAMVRNPQILILDEATSNLDPQTERTVLGTLRRLKQGKTVIIIAHRLSTALCADHIVVLERGRVVEQGTHQELRAAGGLYDAMWNSFLDSRGECPVEASTR